MDERSDWYVVGDSLASFLCKLVDAQGDRFWEVGIEGPLLL